MHVSQQGKSFIASFEKFRAFPYQDQGGKMTVGFGHLITADDPDYSAGLTPAQAAELFANDLAQQAEKPVQQAVDVDVSQQEFDAMCSLCYNIGAGNFSHSTLVRMLNGGAAVQAIGDQFLRWDMVDGKPSNGLYARRIAERDIFLKGVYNNHA